MIDDEIRILSHLSNSGVVQMPGRRFPGIVIQGDSLSGIFNVLCLQDAKARRDEESYLTFLDFANTLQGQLLHYEDTLSRMEIKLPNTQ